MVDTTLWETRLSRRQVLAAGGVAALLCAFGAGPALASPKDVKAKLAELTGDVKAQKGRIAIDLPPYTEYARQVHLSIDVDSPMTDDDYVKAIHILGERNTVPEIASYRFSPLAGRAHIATRVRVARTQIIVVAAEMSDGSVFLGKARCVVARGAGGCG